MDQRAVQQVAEWLTAAERVCVSTGAGMSAESGVETFRGPDGAWSRFKPEELATVDAFRRDPQKVWAWYRARRQQLNTIRPHAGYAVLAGWERRLRELTLVTQNVDGLHRLAGSTRVLELHGRLDQVRCSGCSVELSGLDDLGPDPRCDACGARLRPGVVWFGEMLPEGAIEAAFAAAGACEVLLVIGTSGVVEPAASLVQVAASAGAKLVEINPNATEQSGRMDVCLRANCGPALQAIDAAIRAQSP